MSERISEFFQRKLELRMYGLINIDHPLRGADGVHAHNFWQINLACSGEIRLELEDCAHVFSAGDIVIIPPGVRHHLDYSQTSRYSGFSFKFDLPPEYRDSSLSFALIRTDAGSRLIIEAITNLFNGFFPPEMRWENRQFTVTSDASYPMLMEDILFGMLRYFYFIKPAARREGELLFRIREIIGRQAKGAVSVRSLARALNYSPGHLRVLVQARTGKSTKALIDAERVRLARHYLHYSSLNISEIADEMGFCDAVYFNRFFHKYTGMTPSSYRNRCRQGGA